MEKGSLNLRHPKMYNNININKIGMETGDEIDVVIE